MVDFYKYMICIANIYRYLFIGPTTIYIMKCKYMICKKKKKLWYNKEKQSLIYYTTHLMLEKLLQ